MKDKLTPSPYGPQPGNLTVSKEQFEQIKKLLNVEALMIVAEEKTNDCTGEPCMGHYTFFRSDGFSEHNVAGIGNTMMDYAKPISVSHKTIDDEKI